MVWQQFKRWLMGPGPNTRPTEHQSLPDLTWVEPDASPWGVRLLDVSPVTRTTASATRDPQAARNAMSFLADDGASFRDAALDPGAEVTPIGLHLPLDGPLPNGVLFTPRALEDKWALFHYDHRVLCVRSWQRKLMAVIHLKPAGEWVEIERAEGTLVPEQHDPEFHARLFMYLLHSHAQGLAWPTPLPDYLEDQPHAAALWCHSNFGRQSVCATLQPVPIPDEIPPFRVDSLLHIAAARNDLPALKALLADGLPPDLKASDGLTAVHWALTHDSNDSLLALLDAGASPDARSAEGATPLMNAVQIPNLTKVKLLLERGADPNARDQRGFTALHRAAELGLVQLCTTLRDAGADPTIAVDGLTPAVLAHTRGHTLVAQELGHA